MEETRKRRFARAAAVPIGLLASGALVFAGSQSAFTATTTNAGNSWAAGQVNLSNNGGGASTSFATASTPALFGVTGIKPSSTWQNQCIVVRNTSTLTGDVKFYVTNLVSATGPKTGKLADQLTLRVKVDPAAATCAAAGSFAAGTVKTVYTGTLTSAPANFAAVSASTWSPASNADAAYLIEWQLPDNPPTSDLVQGATASATLNWEIQNT